MTNDNAIIVTKGSIIQQAEAIAKGDQALILMNAKLCVMCDISSSMSEGIHGFFDRRETKYARLLKTLRELQAENPGAIAVLSFSNIAMWCLGGLPEEPFGGTLMIPALELAKTLDGIVERFVMISDGRPGDHEARILELALSFSKPIDCIYIGPEGDDGEKFMRKLAKVKGGKSASGKEIANRLTETVRLSLPSGDEDKPIQL